MNFKREKIKDMYLEDTSVENIFLTEYLPEADGNSIKVYLTALMYADRGEMTNAMIARHLGLQEEDVLQAWNYWESCGVIRKRFPIPGDRFRYEVEFLDLRSRLYSHSAKPEPAETDTSLQPEMNDEMMRELFQEVQEVTGRMMGRPEMEDIIGWVYQDGFTPQFIAFAYKFCVEERRNGNYKYVAALIKSWQAEGITTIEDAMSYLEMTDQKKIRRKRVMQAMGFQHRFPTEAEAGRIDAWFDEMNFSMDQVLEACGKTSGIANPNINYVDKILQNRQNESGSAAKTSGGQNPKNVVQLVNQHYEQVRKRHQGERDERINEVYSRIPRMKALEAEIRSANLSMTKAALDKNVSVSEREMLRQYFDDLMNTKTELLQTAGYDENYMELQYDCGLCQDTGLLKSGERCNCFAELMARYE